MLLLILLRVLVLVRSRSRRLRVMSTAHQRGEQACRVSGCRCRLMNAVLVFSMRFMSLLWLHLVLMGLRRLLLLIP